MLDSPVIKRISCEYAKKKCALIGEKLFDSDFITKEEGEKLSKEFNECIQKVRYCYGTSSYQPLDIVIHY